jgi:hypothetical protein
VNGRFVAESTVGRNPALLDVWTTGLYAPDSAAPFNGTIALSAVIPASLSIADAISVSANPWRLFADHRIVVPVTAIASSLPTLSAATFVPGSLTSTGFRPRVTITF